MRKINWESVIPDFQKGDVITPFETKIERFGLDGKEHYITELLSYASVRRNSSRKEGVYDKNGTQIIPEMFDKCLPNIYDDYEYTVSSIIVEKAGRYGLYDRNGKQIVPTQYQSIQLKAYFVIVCDEYGLYGAYLSDGKKIIECQYDNIVVYPSLDRGLGAAIVSKNNLYGVILESGKEIIPLKFSYITPANSSIGLGFEVTNENHLKGWYSRNGEYNIPTNFCTLKYHNEIEVTTDYGLHGIYSYEGKELLPAKFDKYTTLGHYIMALRDKEISIYKTDGTFLYSTS